jgi:hypothetical protein
MGHKLTIEAPEEAFAALQAATSARRTPEELAAETVSERFVASEEPPAAAPQDMRAAAQAILRANGLLAEPLPVPQFPDADPLPSYRTPERVAFEEELWEELGEAFTKSGLSILDLIERR